jgi:hypothetical protein
MPTVLVEYVEKQVLAGSPVELYRQGIGLIWGWMGGEERRVGI